MTVVAGAGMAGLLAAAMLRRECSGVIESSASLPNNHSAVLRFRSDAVGNLLNIPFKKVSVLKSIHENRNPVADALSYSLKANGSMRIRSITTASNEMVSRYIAPPDFISQLCACVQAPIGYGHSLTMKGIKEYNKPIISTIAMPSLMNILGWQPVEEFKSRAGENLIMEIEDLEAYCSLYVPDHKFPFHRISITGSEVIAECIYDVLSEFDYDELIDSVLWHLCIPRDKVKRHRLTKQKYAKIVPYDEMDRKRFIIWASEKHNVYSLGRFATWRPGLLLDDVVNDVRVIHRLISGASSYDQKKRITV